MFTMVAIALAIICRHIELSNDVIYHNRKEIYYPQFKAHLVTKLKIQNFPKPPHRNQYCSQVKPQQSIAIIFALTTFSSRFDC